MTEEEYLKACGWEQSEDGESGEVYWAHTRRPSVRSGYPRRFTLAEAVDVQTAEDRARVEFVLLRSNMRLIVRGSEDEMVVTGAWVEAKDPR